MKICFLTNELSLSHGWGRYSLGLISALAQKGWKGVVFTDVNSKNKKIPGFENKKILRSLRNDLLKPIFLRYDYERAKKFASECGIVHALVEPYAPLASRLGKGKKFFVTTHGTYATLLFEQPLVGAMVKRSFRQAAKVFCVSRFTQQEILKSLNSVNSMVIPNGVDYNYWQTDKDKKIQPFRRKTILSVGALKPRKGYHVAIEAVARVKLKYRDLKYYIVGEQKNQAYFEQLKRIVRDYQLKDNIIFQEKISDDDLKELYHRSHLFLLTPVNIEGKFEGFGLVYLEANACGKPVIGTKGCGAEDAIEDGANGLLVSQNDVTATSEAILQFLDNPGLAKKLGQQGRQRAKENDWTKVAEKYIEAYGMSNE